MPAPAAARQELLVAQSTLEEIRRIIAAAGWADVHVRGHIRYLWVVVGSRLKNYCDQLEVSRAEGPFAHAIAMRHVLAYKDPGPHRRRHRAPDLHS